MKIRFSVLGKIILAVLVISYGAITEVRAGTITANEVVDGCGSANAANPSLLTKSFDKLCSMDIVFTVTNGTGMNSVVFSEGVTNLTKLTWSDFHMQLGFGFGSGFSSVGNCAVGFATSPLPSSVQFPTRGVSSSAIDWSGGQVQPNFIANFVFTLNVLNLSDCVPPGSRTANGFVFTLRETPSVPEPTAILLLGTGLAAVAIRRWQRR